MKLALPDVCRVCGSESKYAHTQLVLGRPVRYFDCRVCGYVQTQSPDWLEEAYSRAITGVDTGIMVRNQVNVRRVVMTLLAFGKLRGRVIDHAGGYGILVRMLRDVGIDAHWSDKYCENILAQGFESLDSCCDLYTAFEVFEHLVNPLEELHALLINSPLVLMSTELISSVRTPSADWWYYGPEHGQHVGFFRLATLRWMASALSCHQASFGDSLHIFSRTPIPWYWITLVRQLRVAPFVARIFLHSKTTADFDRLRQQKLT
jgi:hypothetical protein